MRTPLIKLDKNVLVKLENFNPTGSHKYRAAKFVIKKAIEDGHIKPSGSTRIIEKSGGNFGVGLAYEASKYSIGVDLVIGLSFSPIKRSLCERFGARVIGLEELEAGLQPKEIIAKLLQENPNRYFFSDQFNNNSNFDAHYYETGMEIVEQLQEMGYSDKEIILVKGAGTGASIMGIHKRLEEHFGSVKTHLVHPSGCDVARKTFCEHSLEGTMVGVYPPFLELGIVHDMIPITQEQAVEGQDTLAGGTGYFCGISSGANVYAACLLGKKMPDSSVVVTIAYDYGEGYLLKQVLNGRNSILTAYKQANQG